VTLYHSGLSFLLYNVFPVERHLPHHGLGPILENEGTISGTYKIIDNLFTKQLGLDPGQEFDGPLYLVYGDQKTVSLIRTVQAVLPYDRVTWLLVISGLFHWRTNYIDMVYDIYGGFKYLTEETMLYHNQTYLDCDIAHGHYVSGQCP
jgi:hypothetical protein